jgi:hypothetical protein
MKISLTNYCRHRWSSWGCRCGRWDCRQCVGCCNTRSTRLVVCRSWNKEQTHPLIIPLLVKLWNKMENKCYNNKMENKCYNAAAYFIKDLQFTLAFCALAVSVSLVVSLETRAKSLAASNPLERFHGNDQSDWLKLEIRKRKCKLQVF